MRLRILFFVKDKICSKDNAKRPTNDDSRFKFQVK